MCDSASTDATEMRQQFDPNNVSDSSGVDFQVGIDLTTPDVVE